MQENNGSNLVTSYSEVQSKTVRWLWYPFIAIGKITILQGDPGDGKSTMMLNLISEISTGGTTPDGKALGAPRRVLYQCSEDGLEDTIKPRLEKCGADCRNVGFINEETGGALTLDDERLRQAIMEYRPRFVVIDPIQAYIGGGADLQVAGKARKLMSRLSMWAGVYECAIVLVGHLNKKEGQKDLYRSFGSIDVVASARSVLQVERDEEDQSIRVVHQIKNSLGPTGGCFRFEIRPETGFKWLGCDLAAGQENLPAKIEPPVFTTKMERAAHLIRQLLADGDMSSKEIYERLSEQGIGHRTAEDTKKEIGVRCYRKMKSWYWSLKPKEEET
ncbi:MAG: AAA family ATPase [Clostridiales bacterium]|nr:AAA family ATPase [Clostridiales bacterium]